MDALADLFVKPVDGHDDIFAFQWNFIPEGKAIDDGQTQVVTVQENGDLIVEGYAAVWDGDDRQGENFAEGAFSRGIKSFLEGQAALCYHHKHDKLLGKFLELTQDQKGLGFKARVDGAIRNHPELGTYYEQIKNGSLRGMSVGGFFKRALVNGAQKIVDVDFTEISATPVPVHPGTSLNVIAGKALENVEMPRKPKIDGEIRAEDEEIVAMYIDGLSRVFDRLKQRGKGSPERPAGETLL